MTMDPQFWTWTSDHPYLTFILAIVLISAVSRLALIPVTRLYRVVMVSIRGWPPPHLDADGDWPATDDCDCPSRAVPTDSN